VDQTESAAPTYQTILPALAFTENSECEQDTATSNAAAVDNSGVTTAAKTENSEVDTTSDAGDVTRVTPLPPRKPSLYTWSRILNLSC
jgi:hypothetical protein